MKLIVVQISVRLLRMWQLIERLVFRLMIRIVCGDGLGYFLVSLIRFSMRMIMVMVKGVFFGFMNMWLQKVGYSVSSNSVVRFVRGLLMWCVRCQVMVSLIMLMMVLMRCCVLNNLSGMILCRRVVIMLKLLLYMQRFVKESVVVFLKLELNMCSNRLVYLVWV